MSDKPIANPANLPVVPLVFDVAPNTTSTNTHVKIISASRPLTTLIPSCNPFAPKPAPAAAKLLPAFVTRRNSSAAPIRPPINWNNMYITQSFALIRPLRKTPSVIAGLI